MGRQNTYRNLFQRGEIKYRLSGILFMVGYSKLCAKFLWAKLTPTDVKSLRNFADGSWAKITFPQPLPLCPLAWRSLSRISRSAGLRGAQIFSAEIYKKDGGRT